MEQKIIVIPGEVKLVPCGGDSVKVMKDFKDGDSLMVVVRFPEIMGLSRLCGCLEMGHCRLVVQGDKWYPALVLDASRWFRVVQQVESWAMSMEYGIVDSKSGTVYRLDGGDV
jgi:hypothetical protein